MMPLVGALSGAMGAGAAGAAGMGGLAAKNATSMNSNSSTGMGKGTDTAGIVGSGAEAESKEDEKAKRKAEIDAKLKAGDKKRAEKKAFSDFKTAIEKSPSELKKIKNLPLKMKWKLLTASQSKKDVKPEDYKLNPEKVAKATGGKATVAKDVGGIDYAPKTKEPTATPAPKAVESSTTKFKSVVGDVEHEFEYDPTTGGFWLVNADGSKSEIPEDSSLRGLIPGATTTTAVSEQGIKAMEEDKADAGIKAESKAEQKTKEQKKEKDRDWDPDYDEPVKQKNNTSSEGSGGSSLSSARSQYEDKHPDYHNIISYYRTGGYGDPKTKQAKYDMGMAILEQLGKTSSQISNIAMANAGKSGNASTMTQWENEQKTAMGNDYEFRSKNKDFDQQIKVMSEELKNNKNLQSQMNDLQKDFTAWTDKHAMEAFGKPYADMDADEREKAFKEYWAARGNQNVAGGFKDWVGTAAGVAGTAATIWAMLRRAK